jgi:polyphosphate:AMP phosphotransferase
MFEAAEIGNAVTREEYDREEPALREQLLAAQRDLRAAGFPVVVVIGGVDGAGKGETVNKLLEWLDPRHVETFALSAPSDEERERPPYWRFWRALPPRGKIGIFFGGWHSAPIVERAYKRIDDAELDRRLDEVNAFERQLAADGALLLKLWMHLSKRRQRKRLRALEDDKRTRWRVTPMDWEHFEMYDRFAKISTHALRRTSTGDAPWTIVEATDRRYQTLTVGRLLLERMRAHLAAQAERGRPTTVAPSTPALPGGKTILSTLDLGRTLDDGEYRDRLEAGQGRLNLLCRKAAKRKVSTVIVFEGVDAAGKGSTIRRITGALDARQYRIVPVAAPTDEERRYPYLWRFWRHLPRAGSLTIFDRSWYGRVLVERVEQLCPPAAWMRAYSEINEFEEQLVRHGTVVVKLWMHVSQDEQLRRFREREETSFKRFKITAEDWRNRERWPAYEHAVADMIERTSTELAPWTLIGSDSKKWSRVAVLDAVADAIERAV